MITLIDSRSNVRHAYHDSLKALGHEVSVFCSAQQFVYSSEAFESKLLIVGRLRGGRCALEPLEWLISVRPEMEILPLPSDPIACPEANVPLARITWDFLFEATRIGSCNWRTAGSSLR